MRTDLGIPQPPQVGVQHLDDLVEFLDFVAEIREQLIHHPGLAKTAYGRISLHRPYAESECNTIQDEAGWMLGNALQLSLDLAGQGSG